MTYYTTPTLCQTCFGTTVREIGLGKFQFVTRWAETNFMDPSYYREWVALGVVCELKAEPDPRNLWQRFWDEFCYFMQL